MNFFRGVLSIGIVIACVLSWIDFDVEIIMVSLSGLTWTPSTILLYVSIFSAGYAFYNSYNNSNHNVWVYLITGLYGIGVTTYIYLSILGLFDFVEIVLQDGEINQSMYNFGIGFYLSGLFSFLLFLTGFDKSENKEETSNYEQIIFEQKSKVHFKKSEGPNKPSISEWRKNNPGKTINDYYSKYK